MTISPGSLSIPVSMSMGVAGDKSAAIVSESGLTSAVVKAAAPLFAGPVSGSEALVTGALAIGLPLPLSDSALALTGTSGKLVFLYVIYTSTGWKSGVKPLTAADLVGTFLRTGVKGFGYFQIAYLATAVEEKEVSSSIRPALK